MDSYFTLFKVFVLIMSIAIFSLGIRGIIRSKRSDLNIIPCGLKKLGFHVHSNVWTKYGYMTEYSVELQRNHETVDILIIHFGRWIATKSFPKEEKAKPMTDTQISVAYDASAAQICENIASSYARVGADASSAGAKYCAKALSASTAGLQHPAGELAHIDQQLVEIERLRATLRTISELDPLKDSDEGYNEWGEAECFRKAKELAIEAMKETP